MIGQRQHCLTMLISVLQASSLGQQDYGADMRGMQQRVPGAMDMPMHAGRQGMYPEAQMAGLYPRRQGVPAGYRMQPPGMAPARQR